MTTKRKTRIGSIAVIVLGYVVGVASYPFLPGIALDDIPGTRAQVAFSLPTAVLVIYLIFRSLWRHDRIRTGNGAFEATYDAIVFRTMLFVFAMNALLMLALTDAMDVVGSHTWGKRVVVVMLGLTFMAIGNLLPRTRPNIAFGVRTARTLTNTQLWLQVHRVGGYTTVGLGAAILIAGLVVTNNSAGGFVLLAAGVAAAIVFVSYRKYANA
ncbi:MAG TPA: SdpI family protein [Vicinamibacterales bacterium]|nr:SdpI family protein [Vicinamibacterales bacterium]